MCKRPAASRLQPIQTSASNVDPDHVVNLLRRLLWLVGNTIMLERAVVQRMREEVAEATAQLEDIWEDLSPHDLELARQNLRNFRMMLAEAQSQLVVPAEYYLYNLATRLQELERQQELSEIILR